VSQLLGGRYDLQEQIGGGGMAVVYRAVDTLLGRQVAVKMLRSQYAGDEEFVNRFRREAQSAASLSHPNIVNLYDVGVTPNQEYYIVMEYVDGPTLKDVIRDRGPLSVKETLDITRQICDALEHAHEHHIIHRDIKPHNILLTRSGHVKVTDFGIARASSGNTITHHHSHSVMGSVHYFSPEQARGAATDVKSDIYSLGVVMYEMLTGTRPFEGDSPVSVALKHLRERFVDPRELNPSIPQSVENIVLKCLVKSPEHRYPDMKALKEDLKDALLHPNVPKFVMPEDVPEQTIAVPIVGGGRILPSPAPEAEEEVKPKRKRWWRVAGWAGVALGVLMVGVFAAYYIVMNLLQVPDVQLPDVRGKTVDQARQILENKGISAALIKEEHETNSKPKGIVFDQDPEGPTTIKQGRPVTLYVSDGPQLMTMPDLTGVPLSQAEQQLVNMGISSDRIKTKSVESSDYDPGYVVATTPAKDEPVSADQDVILEVSQGNMVVVPNVYGKTVDEARQMLENAQLQVGEITYMQGNAADGTVFGTAPVQPGAKVPAGTVIRLYVARNSGESGGGISPPTNGTGDGTGQLPPNAVAKQIDVKVNVPPGKSIHVQVYATDAVSNRKPQVDETISQTKTWTITLYVTPDQDGEVWVYQNGRQTNDVKVPYSS
jgi:eukaryotic-like serine/threonine-protein kinase